MLTFPSQVPDFFVFLRETNVLSRGNSNASCWLGDARCGFADAFEDYVGEVRLAADAGGIPEKFALLLGRVAPGGLTFLEPLLDDAFGFAEHDRDVFKGMESVADEERDHDDVAGGGHGVAIADARVFFHEDGVDLGVFAAGADEFDLAFDGLAGVFVVAGAVTGNEKGGLGWLGSARKRMFLDDVAGAGDQQFGHAFVSANRAAIVDLLGATVGLSDLEGIEARHPVKGEAEFARDNFLGEIPFADEERNNEYPRGECAAKNGGDGGFLFPERFEHVRKNPAAAEFIRMLIGRRGGIGIKGGAVSDQDERGIAVVGRHSRKDSGEVVGASNRIEMGEFGFFSPLT